MAADWCWFGVGEKYCWLDAANRVLEDGAMVVKLLLLWLDSSKVNFVDWAMRSREQKQKIC